jgi:chemotaxis protein MotB
LLFQKQSAEITDSARPVLKNLGKLLSELDISMRIEGHIDDSPGQIGSHLFGWELSAMRAVNVMRFLQKEASISAERITAGGFSQYRPFVPNRTNDDRERNRRVEIIIPVVQAFYERQHGLINKAPPSFKIWDLSS